MDSLVSLHAGGGLVGAIPTSTQPAAAADTSWIYASVIIGTGVVVGYWIGGFLGALVGGILLPFGLALLLVGAFRAGG